MPGWSVEIADEFIRLGARDGRAFDPMKLQELVYIAHGWCLALTGEPLTGDRPEALPYGPEYRRLAKALSAYGNQSVTAQITSAVRTRECSDAEGIAPHSSVLDQAELAWIARIYKEYSDIETAKLATITRAANTPWAQVFADGSGEFRDIPHQLIREQFVELAATAG